MVGKKKFIWVWAVVGALVPPAILIFSRLNPSQQASDLSAFVLTLIFPLVVPFLLLTFISVGFLGWGLAIVIPIIPGMVINGAFYAFWGLLFWRGMYEDRKILYLAIPGLLFYGIFIALMLSGNLG